MTDLKKRKPRGYWTLELCHIEALKYKTRNEWQKANIASYIAAQRSGWLDKCRQHFLPTKAKTRTLAECQRSAAKYNTRTAWIEAEPNIYAYAGEHKWLTECTAHMKYLNQSWTKEKILTSAHKHKTRKAWRAADYNAYNAAKSWNCLPAATAHMHPAANIWTLERCKSEALKYSTKSQWKNNSRSSYAAAKRNNWAEECWQHINPTTKPNGHWSLENCQKSALQYSTRVEWIKNHPASYDAAWRKGWIEKCTEHMLRSKILGIPEPYRTIISQLCNVHPELQIMDARIIYQELTSDK